MYYLFRRMEPLLIGLIVVFAILYFTHKLGIAIYFAIYLGAFVFLMRCLLRP